MMNIRHLLIILLTVGMLAGSVSCNQKSKDELASAALERGLQAHAAGRLDEATAAYREVLDYDPRNKFAFYNLGVIEQAKGNALAAENDYRLAILNDPDYVPALFNLAILRSNASSHQEAIDLYRHIVQVQPDNAGAHLNLGLELLKTGKTDEGNAEIKRARELDPKLAVPTTPTANQTPIVTPVKTSAQPSPSVTR